MWNFDLYLLNEAPIHWAVCNKSTEIIKLLFSNPKTDVNLKNKDFNLLYLIYSVFLS